MADDIKHSTHNNEAERSPREPAADQDLDLRGILGFVAGLIALLLVTASVGWLIYHGLRADLIAGDPPPPPRPEARAPVVPPAPRLQNSPEHDMARFRAKEEALLRSYGMTDQDAGAARIPIERAMDLMVNQGLSPALTGDQSGGGAVDGGAP